MNDANETVRVAVTLVTYTTVYLDVAPNRAGADPRELSTGHYDQGILFEDEIQAARLKAQAEPMPLGGYEWTVTDVRVTGPKREFEPADCFHEES